MRRLAAPMIGGLAVSFLMELLVFPVVFYLAKWLQITSTPPTNAGSSERTDSRLGVLT
jgi:Cu(I)/Ag(I) efflux system membrane protein CusA/SilA